MPDQVALPEEYSVRLPKSAERRKIPPELRESLTEILEGFSQLITEFPGRIKPDEQSPGQFIYCHPDPPLEITYLRDEVNKIITFVTYAAPGSKMPDQVALPEEYTFRYSKTAERQKIPEELQGSLTAILVDFSQLITEFPGRINEQSPGQFIYYHPDPDLEIRFRRDGKIIEFVTYAAPRVATRKLVFISYCKEDEEWLIQLKEFLSPLQRLNIFKICDETTIEPGAVRTEVLKKYFNEANAAVLLVTQKYIASDTIYREIVVPLGESLKAGKLKILWIHVDRCTIKYFPEIKEYILLNDQEVPLSALDKDAQGKVFTEIVEKIMTELGG